MFPLKQRTEGRPRIRKSLGDAGPDLSRCHHANMNRVCLRERIPRASVVDVFHQDIVIRQRETLRKL